MVKNYKDESRDEARDDDEKARESHVVRERTTWPEREHARERDVARCAPYIGGQWVSEWVSEDLRLHLQ